MTESRTLRPLGLFLALAALAASGGALAQQSILPKPATQKPAASKPAASKPAAATPDKPATSAAGATAAKPAAAKPAGTKPAAKAAGAAAAGAGAAAAAQAAQLEMAGAWGAYASQQGRTKICYALSQPRERLPKTAKTDPAYLFVSSRPAEKIKGEFSLVAGFPTKDTVPGEASVGGQSFQLVSKDGKSWVRNPAEEGALIQALAAGSELTVKSTSERGTLVTDKYSLAGFSKIWDRVQKECP